jgi:pyridoxal phosphate enzyme (YggS family)
VFFLQGTSTITDNVQRSLMSGNSTPHGQRLALVRQRIAAAEQRFGRRPGSVGLVAVSKMQTAEAVRAVFHEGQPAFGENYLQEALAKQEALADFGIEWHFIGPIQTNKTKSIARHFDWVHSVDRITVAERLSAQRPDALPPLNVLLQVNVSGEETKAGVAPGELPSLAAKVAVLPRLRLRGLMCIPAQADEFAQQRAPFARLRGLLEALREQGQAADTLSMGMSEDLEAAVAEGATLVRIGTAIFGPRPAKSG